MQGKPNAEVCVRTGVEQLSALSAFRGKGWRALDKEGKTASTRRKVKAVTTAEQMRQGGKKEQSTESFES